MHVGQLMDTKLQGEKGNITLQVDRDTIFKIMRYKQNQVELKIDDNRHISTDQRRKIYATIKDMSEHIGHDPEALKQLMKFELMARTGGEYFSLSNCSVEQANEYLNFLVKMCIDWDIPLSDRGVDRAGDIDAFLYNCLKDRRCAISGTSNAQIHHVDRVGMGRNRNKVDHTKLKLIALSEDWHEKVHLEGEEEIFKKYKVYGIYLDRLSLKKLGIQKGEID